MLELVFLTTTILVLLLYLRERALREKSLRLDQEALVQMLKTTHKALSQVEVTGIKKLQERYAKHLAALFAGSGKRIKAAEGEFTKYLDDLQSRAKEAELAQQEELEQRLSKVLTEAQQKSLSALEKDLQEAREAIKAYHQSQLKLAQDNLISILERTLNLILDKQLTLSDQSDLVYEAFERAKKENLL